MVMPDTHSRLNDQINELVTAGNTEAAVKLLYEAIVSAAKSKDFSNAEALREQLYEIDAMALTEIVKSGEIIEQEKNDAINSNHKRIWSSLYATLTKEEANTFFFSLEEKKVDTNHLIITQGDLSGGLLFINLGQAKSVWRDGSSEVLLAVLDPGNVAGHDTFFDVNVATTSLIALTPLRYYLLKKEKTKLWDQTAPSLLYRIKEYCRRFERPGDWVLKKGVERRKHRRFQLTGKIKIQLLNSAGNAISKPLSGDLSNISEGGVGFQLLLPSQQTAAVLLGRNLKMTFSIEGNEGGLPFETIGIISSITDLWLNEYAIHVRFETLLPPMLTQIFSHLIPLGDQHKS
jgi:hypothetical protein